MNATPGSLKDVSWFEGFSDDQRQQLESLARWTEAEAGATLFRDGAPASEVFVVVEGTVSLEICTAGIGCRRVLTVGAGDLLGWSPLVENARLTATARCLTPTRLVAFEGPQLLAVCEHDPRLGFIWMQRTATALAQRLSAARLQLLDVYGPEPAAALPGDTP